MRYLETGSLPSAAERVIGGQTIPPWPLPKTGLAQATERGQRDFPMTETLIDIAIAENRPDQVVRWYDQRIPGPFGWGWTWFQENRIAESLADTYPDRALAIWKKLAESQIAQTQPKAYELAAGFLRSMRRTLQKLGREKEWQSYLAGLRQANVRKRRFLEVLDGLEGRSIIESK